MRTQRKDGRSGDADVAQRRGLRRRLPKTSPSMLVALVALVLAAAGGAAAAIPDTPGGTIHVCYDPADARRDADGATLGIIDKAVNPRDCDSDSVELTLNQKGDPGMNGAPGKDGVSGYEVVETRKENVPVPIDNGFGASCPTGKKPLGGGGLVQLYSPTTFVGLGTVTYSIPNGSSWDIYVKQPSVNGATNAIVTIRVVCATVLP